MIRTIRPYGTSQKYNEEEQNDAILLKRMKRKRAKANSERGKDYDIISNQESSNQLCLANVMYERGMIVVINFVLPTLCMREE